MKPSSASVGNLAKHRSKQLLDKTEKGFTHSQYCWLYLSGSFCYSTAERNTNYTETIILCNTQDQERSPTRVNRKGFVSNFTKVIFLESSLNNFCSLCARKRYTVVKYACLCPVHSSLDTTTACNHMILYRRTVIKYQNRNTSFVLSERRPA